MDIQKALIDLFENTINEKVENIYPLPRSASFRRYFRILSHNHSLIGTYNPNREENIAFLYMSDFFYNKGFNVPKIYAKDIEKNIYLQQDLGNTTLLDFVQKYPEKKISLLRKTIDYLIKFQFVDFSQCNWSVCYPSQKYDYQTYMIDLYYFKYIVLKILKVQYNDLKLEREFKHVLNIILSVSHKFFVYRDFQSRNILVNNNDLFFIDYQGGRQGSLFYDLASLLYDTKLGLSEEECKNLSDYYYEKTFKLFRIEKDEFEKVLLIFALIRKLQALAAYTLKGLIERKIIFLLGIEKSFVQTLDLFKNKFLVEKFSLLYEYLLEAKGNLPFKFQRVNVEIEINSFSYLKQGYPEDKYENGGGYVFDCRMLPNPGRYSQFKNKTGLDKEVREWLDARFEFEDYIINAFELIYKTILSYKEKGYTHLQINFGCTGGQHRSVYCAEKMAWLLKQFFNTKINIYHRQQDSWKFL